MTDKLFPEVEKLGALIFLRGNLIWFTKRGNRETSKTISPAALRAAVEGLDLDTGWLDPTVRPLRWGMSRKHEYAFVYMPPARATIRIEDDQQRLEVLNVPLPGLVFANLNQSYAVWAVRDEPLASTPTFHAPFPNIYQDGHVCWGDNPHEKPGLATIAASFATFLRTPFTGHGADLTAAHYRKDVRQLWRVLAGQPAATPLPGLEAHTGASAFPLDELLPTNKTLAVVAEGFLQTDKRTLYVPTPGANVR